MPDSRLRSLARRGGRLFFRPGVLAAIYVLVLTVMAELRPLQNEGDDTLGEDPAEVARWIVRRFSDAFIRLELTLSFTALGIGAVLGIIAGTALRFRRDVTGQPPLTGWRFVLAAFALAAALHAAMWSRGVAVAPQAYAASWYAVGGLSRAIQLVITETLGPRGTLAVIAVVVLAMVPPPWRVLPERRRRAAIGVGGAAVAVLLAIAIASGVGPRATPTPIAARPAQPAGRGRPNVLIIGADSFRADAFNERVMPNLWRVAREGTNFTKAYVTIPRTDPSWATLLTGRYPSRHHITSIFTRSEEMSAELDAVPARLTQAGYRSIAVTDAAVQVFRYGNVGFTDVLAPDINFPAFIEAAGMSRATPILPFLRSPLARRELPILRNAASTADPAAVAEEAVGELRRVNGQPWLLTVFFTEPHFPYDTPAPQYDRFTDRAYRGRYKYDKPTYVSRFDSTEPHELAQLRAVYDGTLAGVDDAAGRILEEIKERGEAENTIVVILGDHGEDLLEHGWIGHGDSLFCDHQLHIPLAIVDRRAPSRGDGQTSAALVRDVDLAPTLYELTGIAPPPALDGRSLVPALKGAALEPVLVYGETEIWLGPTPGLKDEMRMHYPAMQNFVHVEEKTLRMVLRRSMDAITTAARHRIVFDGRWKLMYLPLPHEVRWLLFDTTTDPLGAHDVSADRPDVVASLKEKLWAWMLLDPAVEERNGFLALKGARIMEIDGPVAPGAL